MVPLYNKACLGGVQAAAQAKAAVCRALGITPVQRESLSNSCEQVEIQTRGMLVQNLVLQKQPCTLGTGICSCAAAARNHVDFILSRRAVSYMAGPSDLADFNKRLSESKNRNAGCASSCRLSVMRSILKARSQLLMVSAVWE